MKKLLLVSLCAATTSCNVAYDFFDDIKMKTEFSINGDQDDDQ